jgi:hypothetical protein
MLVDELTAAGARILLDACKPGLDIKRPAIDAIPTRVNKIATIKAIGFRFITKGIKANGAIQ